MKYTIASQTKKNIPSLNKDVISAALVGEDGILIENVQIWQGFPNFDALAANSVVEGDIVTKVNGKYTNSTLYAPKATTGASRGGSGANAMKVQDRIEKSVEKTLDTKEVGIKLSSSMRDGVQLALAEIGVGGDSKRYEMAILRWRKFILDNWGDASTISPF